MSARNVEIRFLGSTKQLEEALARAGIAAEAAGKEIGDKMGAGVNKTGGMLNRLGQSMSNWGIPFGESVSKAGDKLAEAQTKGQKFSQAMSTMGGVTLAAGAAGVAAVGVESLKLGMNFQRAMTQVQTGAGESAANLKMVSDGVLSMAGAVGQTPLELAKGLYTIESAGYHGAAGLKVLRAAAEGAATGNASMGTVADAVTTVLNAYGMSAKNSTAVVNQLIGVEKSGKSHLEDVAASLSAVVPLAAAAHLSFAQVGGALATMTGQGMSAQQATQDLANTIRSLQNPNSVAVAEIEQLGLRANDVETSLGKRGLTGTLDMLTRAITSHMGPAGTVILDAFNKSKSAAGDLQVMLHAMSPSMRKLADEFMSGKMTMTQFRKALPTNEQGVMAQFEALYAKVNGFNNVLKSGSPAAQTYTAALAKMMGGSTGLNTALMLTGGHTATFAANVRTVGAEAHAAGGQVDGFSAVQKDLAFQLQQAKAGAEALGTRIGVALIPKVEEAIKATEKIIGWFEKHKAAAEALAGVIGTVLGGAVATFALNKAVAFGKSVAGMGRAVGELATTMLTKLGIIEVAQETEAATAEATGAATEAAMGPIGLAIAAVGFAAMELATHWHAVWNGIKTVIKDAWGWIKQHAGLIIGVALGPIAEAAFQLATHWHTVWNGIKTVVRDVWDFIRPIFEAIKRAIGDIVGAIGKIAGIGKDIGHGIGHIPVIGGALKHIPLIGGFFAEGGVVTKPTLAMVGEAGPELVLPLNKPARMADLLGLVAGQYPSVQPLLTAGAGAAGARGGITPGEAQIIDLLRQLVAQEQWARTETTHIGQVVLQGAQSVSNVARLAALR